MIQGTGSNVGKSVLVAGILRALHNRGYKVAPFKPQNMSNNAAVTKDGGEIGRAQALQAIASHLNPHTDMNPILLKPESTTGSQVVVQGKVLTTVKGKEYGTLKHSLLPRVLESFERLSSQVDIVVVEGAGSPAEINLRPGDIANMGFAEAADVPVILTGDIDRGGVIAQVVGTHSVLPPADRDLIKGFIINKFRGDVSLFDDGYKTISDMTQWTGLGVIPWFDQAHLLPAEDSMDIKSGGSGQFKIVVPKLPRISNFDDLDPLKCEQNIEVVMLTQGNAIPGDTDLVILPGSKSTIADLAFLRAQNWDQDIFAHVRRGGHVLGICGGYQMLGNSISDPDGVEGIPSTVQGLGLLDVDTIMTPKKHLTEVRGTALSGNVDVSGYEIHIGETDGPDCTRSWIRLGQRTEGAQSPDGRIMGAYLHGIFAGDAFRSEYLEMLGQSSEKGFSYSEVVQKTLNDLADHLEKHLDIDRLIGLAK